MLGQAYYAKVDDFCDRLRQRRVNGSLAAAKGTAELMRQLVTSSKLADPHAMLAEVRSVGLTIQAAKPIGACATFIIFPLPPPCHFQSPLTPLPFPPMQSWSLATWCAV